jgi:hypothetical protein
MSADPEHDQIAELLGAYALHAVGPEEAARIDDHRRGCPECQAELDALRETAAGLGTTVEQPPAVVWDRIAAQVAARSRPPRPAPPLPPAGPPTADDPGPAEVTPLRRRRRRVVAAALAGVAAGAAVVGLVVAAVGSGPTPQTEGPAAAFAAAQSIPGHHLVTLETPDGRAAAQIVVVPGGRGYLAHSTMPRLPAGRTYQLWAVIAGRTISLGLLGAHPGAVAFTVASSATPSGFAVTAEPATGSVVPEGPRVASGSLT